MQTGAQLGSHLTPSLFSLYIWLPNVSRYNRLFACFSIDFSTIYYWQICMQHPHCVQSSKTILTVVQAFRRGSSSNNQWRDSVRMECKNGGVYTCLLNDCESILSILSIYSPRGVSAFPPPDDIKPSIMSTTSNVSRILAGDWSSSKIACCNRTGTCFYENCEQN